MVSYINSTRKPGEPVVAHPDFMKKVPKVLGEQVGNFSSMFTATVGNGAKREQKIYNFPKREAMLMAMSHGIYF